MILFVIIHSLIFRLAKVVFYIYKRNLEASFFVFTPENHENLATFCEQINVYTMILKRISILNYKNLEEVELGFSAKLNCFSD